MTQPRLEDYWQGKPLTPEHARLRAGEDSPEPQASFFDDRPSDYDDPDRDLTKAERMEIERLYTGAGWKLVTRLIKRALRRREKAAMVLSQNDSLNNRDQIATEWAYVSIWRGLGIELEATIQSEITILRNRAPKPEGTEE